MLQFLIIFLYYRLTSDCIEDLSSVIYGPKRSNLLSGLIQKTIFNPQLISCKWRIDITISSKYVLILDNYHYKVISFSFFYVYHIYMYVFSNCSILNRVLEPNIVMEWIYNTGERITFELSLAKFHQLRHAIATILIELQALQYNNIFKIMSFILYCMIFYIIFTFFISLLYREFHGNFYNHVSRINNNITK